jgi:hypothetical protein
VLAPERADDAELGEGRLAPEHRDEYLVFVLRETVLGHQCRRDDRVARPRLDAHRQGAASSVLLVREIRS